MKTWAMEPILSLLQDRSSRCGDCEGLLVLLTPHSSLLTPHLPQLICQHYRQSHMWAFYQHIRTQMAQGYIMTESRAQELWFIGKILLYGQICYLIEQKIFQPLMIEIIDTCAVLWSVWSRSPKSQDMSTIVPGRRWTNMSGLSASCNILK